jgi:arsenite-transporting ATPase
MQLRAEEAMNAMPDTLVDLPRTLVPLSPNGMLGIESLRMLDAGQKVKSLGPIQDRNSAETDGDALASSSLESLESLGTLIDDLAAVGHGVILAMGKGGVGKTTVAAAIATALAERSLPVHLSTTDPAAHITATIAGDKLPNMTVDRIDPVAETASYSKEVMANAGEGLDEAGLALLEEDLRSPCTEEIAVFRAFAKAVAEGQDRFVVLDTAPTGHTILLLSSQMPEAVKELLPRLRDPEFTRVLIVTLPEATPVHEADQLQGDLRRADIVPYAWVINQSLTPLTVTDPGLQSRRQHELPYIREAIELHAARTVIIPWQAEPPTGREGLNRLAAIAST